jgi:DNA-binding LytR/AlgR family response regulator
MTKYSVNKSSRFRIMEEIFDKIPKTVVLKTSLGFVYFDYIEIILCSADGNCSNVFILESENPVRVLHSLSYIEKKYCNDTLLRCHKSYIINSMHLEKLLLKQHQVQLKGNYRVPLSSQCWKKISQMSKIKTLGN